MKAGPPGFIWSKYECFLMSGCRDMKNLNIKQCDMDANDQGDYNSSPCTSYRRAKKDSGLSLGGDLGGKVSHWHFSLFWAVKMYRTYREIENLDKTSWNPENFSLCESSRLRPELGGYQRLEFVLMLTSGKSFLQQQTPKVQCWW